MKKNNKRKNNTVIKALIILFAIVILILILCFNKFFDKKTENQKQTATSVSTTKTNIEKDFETENDLENVKPLSDSKNQKLREMLLNVDENYSRYYNYIVAVNIETNLLTVYEKEDGKFTKPIKAMICSSGAKGSETPQGEFKMKEKILWCLMVDDTYGRYITRFNGSYMIHSVPYKSKNAADLDYKSFNELGESVSHGCIRLSLSDAKWIYDNVKFGTKLIVYKSDVDTLSRPKKIIIDENSPLKKWDPTDPEKPSN